MSKWRWIVAGGVIGGAVALSVGLGLSSSGREAEARASQCLCSEPTALSPNGARVYVCECDGLICGVTEAVYVAGVSSSISCAK